MKRLWSTFITTSLIGLCLGCSAEGLKGTGYEKWNKPAAVVTASDNETGNKVEVESGQLDPDSQTKVVTRDITSSGASLQVKDIVLLRSSIESCMGSGMLNVTDEMLIPEDSNANPPALADGKVRFLLASNYVAGDDIIVKESGNLVDFSNGSRTSNSADSLTDTYLRSLETIGNVIAHNCTLNNPNCQCANQEQALAMMSRCFPGLNPKSAEMADTANLFGAICNDGNNGMRKAVSSLIASYAFATSR